MSQLSLPASTPATANPSESDGLRLHGRWLLLARVGWVVVTVTLVILNLIALPDTYESYFNFTPQVLQDLHRLGLSPTLYSILLIVENAPLQLVYLALALLLFWRRSADRMALFCSFALVAFGNAAPLFDFTNGSTVPTLAANAILRVVTLVLFAMGEASLTIFFYVFPSGRFAPRWTRWATLIVGLYWLAVVFFPTLPSSADTGPAPFLVPFFLVSAAVAQIYRYRRVSTPRERQQTKWAVFGFALAMLLLAATIPITALVLPSSLQNDPVLGSLNPIFQVAFLLIAIFIAVAILRSRLWDIDTLINKTLVYGLLTALLGALYAGLIVGLEALAGVITGSQASQNPLVLVISTLAIAALFYPARRRIQNVIDRRFYRKKYDAEKTLAAFSATLRNEVDLEQLREHLIAVVQETMQPAHVSLWLRQPERRPAERAYRLEPGGQAPARPGVE